MDLRMGTEGFDTMRLCVYCGKETGGICKCGRKGTRKAYLEITNIISDILGDALDRTKLSDTLMQRLKYNYRCPLCFSALPTERRMDAAGDTDDEPGACPKCRGKWD